MLEVQIVRNNGTIDFNFEDIKDALASERESLSMTFTLSLYPEERI